MQAWQVKELGEPSQALELVDKQLPPPGPGEIRIAVAVAGVGLPDVLLCRGDYAMKPELPFTPGQEVAGTVLETGEGVSFAIGDRVMGVTAFFNGQGSFAQECMSMEGMVYPIDDGMSDSHAAGFVIPYHTAWLGLVNRGQLGAGDVLLVLGAAGGSGSTAIQVGKGLGARVIAVAGGEKKARQCLDFGADEIIDYRSTDVVAEVNRLTEGRGADVIYDPVGGELGEKVIGCIANEGRLLAIGFASGAWAKPRTSQLVARNASLVGVYVGAYTPEQRLLAHEQLLRFYADGKITPPLDHVAVFNELPAALTELAERRINGKLVVKVT